MFKNCDADPDTHLQGILQETILPQKFVVTIEMTEIVYFHRVVLDY